MPHLVLEYSDNIIESDFITLFQSCHQVLVQELPTQLDSCKSRALKHTTYYIGNGKVQNAFVIVNIRIMPGRHADTLQKTGMALMDVLKTHFASSLKNTDCQITLEINEIGTFYFKS